MVSEMVATDSEGVSAIQARILDWQGAVALVGGHRQRILRETLQERR